MNDKKNLDTAKTFDSVAKTVATLAFAAAVGAASIHMGVFSLKNEELTPHKALASVFLALNIRRGYKNLKAAFDNDAQPTPETRKDISIRESFNVSLQSSLINAFIYPSQFTTSAPFVIFALVTRDICSSAPEGDKGHLRPAWLRKIMGDGPK